MEKFNFYQIIEVSLHDLKTALLVENFNNDDEYAYAQALVYYLEADLESFKAITLDDIDLSRFLNLRLMLLEQSYDLREISNQLEQVDLINKNYLGEFYFIMGLIHTKMKEFDESKRLYTLAFKHLKQLNSPRKAVKSLLNIVVADSRHQEHKKLILDYQFVANEAKKVGDDIVQGICYQNISREHQKLGALELALKFANEALDLQQNDAGVDHFYHALIHRCHVLIALGRFKEAVFDYQKVKASQNPEIQESVKVITALLGDKKQKIEISHLEPTWRERLYAHRDKVGEIKLTKQESNLVASLANGKKSKDILIEELYGNKIDWFAAESRFKMLLSRFRKKYPNQIIFSSGLYELVDESYLNEHLPEELLHEA